MCSKENIPKSVTRKELKGRGEKMKKQFFRVKQLADQTFARAEKSEVLSEDMVIAEKKVEALKHICQTASKKIQSSLLWQGTDSPMVEKRLKKIPQFLLGNAMQESSALIGEESLLGFCLEECGKMQTVVGNELMQFEVDVEQKILNQLHQFTEGDIPAINKQRRNLSKLTLDMDAARTRYQTASRHLGGPNVYATKIEGIKDEMDEAQSKVEQCRDSLAADMFLLLSREPEVTQLFIMYMKLQKNYFKSVLSILEEGIPLLEANMRDTAQKPVYGCSLEEHLRVTEREIAYPIEMCVCALIKMGLDEEGLFRITGGSSKVRKLKTAFDAGLVDWESIMEYRDIHVVAGALKLYMRELPEPLTTNILYDEWMAAARIQDSNTKLQALWAVIHKLPLANFNNLHYLIRFFAFLADNHEENKMTPQNIAIVIAPNLIWSQPEESSDMIGVNMSMMNTHSSIIDLLVTYADWFFPGEIDFFISFPKTDTEPVTPNQRVANGPSSSGSNSLSNPLREPANFSAIGPSPKTHKRSVSIEGSVSCHRRTGSTEDQSSGMSTSDGEVCTKHSSSNSAGSLTDHSPPYTESPKPAVRRKNKPAPIPPGLKESKCSTERPDRPPPPGVQGVPLITSGQAQSQQYHTLQHSHSQFQHHNPQQHSHTHSQQYHTLQHSHSQFHHHHPQQHSQPQAQIQQTQQHSQPLACFEKPSPVSRCIVTEAGGAAGSVGEVSCTKEKVGIGFESIHRDVVTNIANSGSAIAAVSQGVCEAPAQRPEIKERTLINKVEAPLVLLTEQAQNRSMGLGPGEKPIPAERPVPTARSIHFRESLTGQGLVGKQGYSYELVEGHGQVYTGSQQLVRSAESDQLREMDAQNLQKEGIKSEREMDSKRTERESINKPGVPNKPQLEKKYVLPTEFEKPKPVIPDRPALLRLRDSSSGADNVESKEDCGASKDLSQTEVTSGRITLEKAHVYSVDKQQVSIVQMPAQEQEKVASALQPDGEVPHGRPVIVRRTHSGISDKLEMFERSDRATKPEVINPAASKEAVSSQSRVETNEEPATGNHGSHMYHAHVTGSKMPVTDPGVVVVPQRPPRPQPPLPPGSVKPRSGSNPESTDL